MFHAQVLAEELMYNHGLLDWKFCFDRAKKRFGRCDYTKKQISISASLTQLNSEEHVKDTILHEIAHALAGYEAGHGPKWKEIITQIGGKPNRCYGTEEIIIPKLKYTATCPQCSFSLQRKTKPKPGKYIACVQCCKKYNKGKFTKKFVFVFAHN